MCPVCRGRGEVEAGVSLGAVEYGPVTMGYDWRGNLVPTRASFPRGFIKNPKALVTVQTGNKATDHQDIFILESNSFGDLWGIAVCGACHGTGQ
jgi:hypothetical protein